MTPKEKAQELVEKIAIYHWTDVCNYEGAKQCALVAVDEILNFNTSLKSIELADVYYWLDVKNEITKL